MIEEYFTLDDEGFPIMKPIIKTIKYFKNIIEADKGSKGDHDGRKKLKATKEIAFIYFYCNKDLLIGYSKRIRIEKCKSLAGLEKNYELTPEVQFAINELIDDLETPTQKSVRVFYQTLLNFVDVMDIVGNRNTAMLDYLKSVTITSLTEDELKLYKSYMSTLEDDLGKTLKYNTDLPKAIEQVQMLEMKLKKEVVDQKNAGKKTSNKWEDE